MSKQDRQGARTIAALEQKYNFGKSFGEVMGLVESAEKAANTATEAVSNLDRNLDQEEIFNRLTKNGESEGVYRDEDGQIYINASYIKSGIIDAAIVQVANLIADNIISGKLSSKDGNTCFDLDKSVLSSVSENRCLEISNGGVFLKTPSGVPTLFLAEVGGGMVGFSDTEDNTCGALFSNSDGLNLSLRDPLTLSWKNNGDGTYTLIGT